MIITTGVTDINKIKAPSIKRIMLALAVQRSFETVLVLKNANVPIKGSTMMKSTTLTAARSDKRSPA